MRPWVYHRYATAGKIDGIARRDGGTLGAGGGGIAVKRQDAAREILDDHGIYRGHQLVAARAFRQHGSTAVQFSLSNRAQVQIMRFLRGEPGQHGFGWCGAHEFGNHIGIQQDHGGTLIVARRCRHGLARRQVQLNAADCGEAAMDCLAQVL